MDSIYKILESLDQVSENKESGVKITNIQWKDPDAKLPGSLKLNITAPSGSSNEQIYNRIHDELKDEYGEADDFEFQFEESLEEGQYDGKSREELMKMKAKAEADIKNMQSSGSGPQEKFYDETQMMMAQKYLDDINNALAKMGESVEEAMEDEDGASADDIASAITRRMMAHPKFGALVREIDIIDLNDAIEDIAQFHKGGDLGTSDVSNMVNDVLKQLGKPDALKEEEVNEEDIEEDNAFNTAAAEAAKDGKKEFEFNGKTYPVKMDKNTAHSITDDVNEDEDSMPASPDEGGMAGDQAEFIKYAVDEIKDHIEAGGDFPEWFQNKMSDVYGKMKDLHGYMEGDKRNDAEQEEEAEVELEETTVAGAVAVAADAAGKNVYSNPSVYESMNNQVENMITESMNVSVNSSNDPSAEPSITVSATGEDAMALAQLLQLASVEKPACESCGRVHEGSCMNEAEEANSADNTHTYDMKYLLDTISGGLNAPKRQINPNNPGDNPMAMSAEKVVNIEESEDTSVSHLESLYKEFKAK